MARLYPASETAYILRLVLGPIRGWQDALADMRRGKTHINGLVLKPVARLHDGIAWRPEYDARDIAAFIKAVREVNEEARTKVPPQFKEVEIDENDRRYGIVRKLHKPIGAVFSSYA